MKKIIIVGGGLAGLVNGILLSRAGFEVLLFEKKSYPFHRVCGEYISNEVKPFLIRNDLFPIELNPTTISKFILTSTNGRQARLDLEMGGFGISRYALDYFLYKKALASGVEVRQNTSVTDVLYRDNEFEVSCGQDKHFAPLVIAAQGKRSKLDANLNRDFMTRKSPYLAVKHHIRTDFPKDTIALHNFKDGYCGISQVENKTYNLCYLSHRNNLRTSGNIAQMEKEILSKNPFLKSIFENTDFVFDQPLVINEISFEKKNPVENHVLMSGDSAGMITPLCGNGMAMAIHSAKILSETIIKHWKTDAMNREAMETEYHQLWHRQFANRLSTGRTIQRLFGSTLASNIGVTLAKIQPIARQIVGLTHGREF